MSRPEIDLRLRFNDTATLVAFLTRPPAGVKIVVEEDDTPVTRGKDKLQRRFWTPAEEERLLDLYTSGVGPSAIGVKLNRTYASVHARLTKLGAYDPDKENDR